MIITPAETKERSKAIKHLMATWKANVDIRQKASLVLQMNLVRKIKKSRGFMVP